MNLGHLTKYTLLIAVLCLTGSCNQCSSEDTPTAERPNLSFKQGQSFVLEMTEIELDKVMGGDATKQKFKHFMVHNNILMFSQSKERHVYMIGMSSPISSYGESSYVRIRGRSDKRYIHLPPSRIKLVRDTGTSLHMDISQMRISPSGKVDSDGVIQDGFRADVQGSLWLEIEGNRFSAEFYGTWRGHKDTQPPEVLIVPPAEGLVSGSFEIYFDEPVKAVNIPKRVFLRRANNKAMRTRIKIMNTDIKDYTTHLRVETQDMLPFNENLTLAVGTGFSDMAGHTLQRPVVKVLKTPNMPPAMNESGTNFAKNRIKELHLQGDTELVASHLGKVKPYSGQLLRITPPAAGSRYTSAVVTRMKVAGDAQELRLRVLKSASSMDSVTPCLRYSVAHIDGLLWNVECGPTDVPTTPITYDGVEHYITPWVELKIPLEGQQTQEVLVVLEARPLSPDVKVTSKPVFIVDMLRTLWEGQNPEEF